MTRKSVYALPFKRKRTGKTNYRKRIKILLASKPRLVVRKSLNNICAQVIEYKPEGDRVILSAHSSDLDEYGWKMNRGNLSSAYLVGLLIGKKAKKQGVKELVLDLGLYKSTKGSRVYALLKGCIDAGLNIPHSNEILPDEKRIRGEHIINYAAMLKKNNEYEKVFSNYAKNKVSIESFQKYFDETKNKILGA